MRRCMCYVGVWIRKYMCVWCVGGGECLEVYAYICRWGVCE